MEKTVELETQTDEMETERRRFLCPACSKHTILWLLPSTHIKDLPIKCKRCGKEIIVNISPNSEEELL